MESPTSPIPSQDWEVKCMLVATTAESLLNSYMHGTSRQIIMRAMMFQCTDGVCVSNDQSFMQHNVLGDNESQRRGKIVAMVHWYMVS